METKKTPAKQKLAEHRKQSYPEKVKGVLKNQFVRVSETLRYYESGFITQQEFNIQIAEEIHSAIKNLLKLRLELLGNVANEELEKLLFEKES